MYGEKGKDGVIIIKTKQKSNTPVYVIDNKIISPDFLRQLDINSIESISILKDQEALDKYGEGAKNGVIIINTKSY